VSESQAIRGVLFDATGTLFDLRESVGAVYSRMASAEGIELPAWRIDDAFSRIMARAPARVFPDMSLEKIAEHEREWWYNVVRSTFLATDSTVKFPDFAGFFARLFDYYARAEAWELRPGAHAALLELRRSKIATGVVSNFDQRLGDILESLDIASLLDSVTTPAICGAEKPDAAIFEAALKSIALPAAEVLFVGDHPEKDREAARRVGMRSLDPNAIESLAEIPRQL
jgi:putative hydrolase of the HAD superfamily